MPPRELLPLRLPERRRRRRRPTEPGTVPQRWPDLNPFERGPEITEVR